MGKTYKKTKWFEKGTSSDTDVASRKNKFQQRRTKKLRQVVQKNDGKGRGEYVQVPAITGSY